MGGRGYGPGRVLVIAEIGTGHGGDPAKAAELCAAAAEAGADCAKFQCVIASEIIHPKTGVVPLPGGDIALFERFRELELDEGFYAAAKEAAEARGLVFLCTPFGLESARLLRRLGVAAMKVASPELNHLGLLDELASYGLPTILSSGVSTLADIETALARLAPPSGEGPAGGVAPGLALLHCVTAYPAPAEDYNLSLLGAYASLFGVPVGVSDHSLDPVLVPALSVAAGGVIVEKHICLSREDPGLDDPIALPPADFARMTASVRAAQTSPAADTVEGLSSAYGRLRVERVMGDGVKRLAPSERANYGRTNRSIHALRDIAEGEAFGPGNLALLRTEKVLKVGLAPALLDAISGRRARRAIPSGEGIEWEDVGDLG
ncbi:MAG TPA: N-acetylneuraminate synthase family protein [Rectinemataceae bacterium]|nr:N-acetylneuraminate synthase family protein [Rectinemataceae bacterium]